MPAVGVMASSADNIAYFSKLINIQTIGFDKINQLRHVLFLKDKAHTLALMKQHAAILAPQISRGAGRSGQGDRPAGHRQLQAPRWRLLYQRGRHARLRQAHPGPVQGGKRHHDRCRCHASPYGKDPQDSNIRIAPSLPPVAELEQAIAVFCTCLKLAALEKLGV